MSQKNRSIAATIALVFAGLLLVWIDFPPRGFGFDVSPEQPASRIIVGDAELTELTQAVGLLREHYVFEARLQPRRMLLAALQALGASFNEFLVLPPVDLDAPVASDEASLPAQVTVSYKDLTLPVDVSAVSDLYSMSWKLTELVTRLSRDEATRKKMEDAVIEGILSVLDPHTNYLDEAQYREMQVSTKGRFGGLGIVIQVRDGQLNVVSIMPGTPAARAGLKKGDHIVRIGSESTVNLTVSEAANRMRGDPGTSVELSVLRAGEQTERHFKLTREEIKVASVLTKALPLSVAYLLVKGFQQDSAEEIRDFLDQQYPETPPAGIILDLRGNSGGVMAAAVEMADLFLKETVIVSTLEKDDSENRSELAITGDRFEEVPLIVLVDHSSASASEIVAAALKYTGRALIVGDRTFGKGSVQYLQELSRGALKLTVAQYVGPHREMIQGLGIQPDISLLWVDDWKEPQMPEFGEVFEGEGALPYHLQRNGTLQRLVGPAEYHYCLPEPDLDLEELDYDEVLLDAPAHLAFDILVTHGAPTADKMLRSSSSLLAEFQVYEDGLLAQTLSSDGRSWEDADVPAQPLLVSRAHFEPTSLEGGANGTLTISVSNQGLQTLPRLYARTDSIWRWLSGLSCTIGTLAPGETGQCSVEVSPPRNSPQGEDNVHIDILTGLDEQIDSTGAFIQVEQRPRARMSLRYWVEDAQGNGNSLAEVGESFDLVLQVTNVGDGALEKGLAVIKNSSGGALFIREGRQDIANLMPGQSQRFRFVLKAQESPENGAWSFDIGVVDLDVKRQTLFSDSLPLVDADGSISEYKGNLAAESGLEVRIAPEESAGVLARISRPGRISSLSRMKDWVLLDLGETGRGWVKGTGLSGAVGQEEATFEAVPVVEQPWIVIEKRIPEGVLGSAASMILEGYVDFGRGHRPEEAGLAVFNNQRKLGMVYFGSPQGDPRRVPFRFEFPLEDNGNRVVLTAFQKALSLGYTWLQYNREVVGP